MAEDKLHLQVITMTEIVYDKMVSIVDLRLENGYIGIMPGSEPLLGSVVDGPLKCIHDGKKEYLYVGAGILEVNNNNVNLLVNAAELAEEIDPIRVTGALERANAVLKEDLTPIERETALADKLRAEARIKTYNIYTYQSDIL